MLPFPFVTLGFPWLILFTISRLAFAINYSQFCFIPWLSLFNLGFTWLDLVCLSFYSECLFNPQFNNPVKLALDKPVNSRLILV